MKSALVRGSGGIAVALGMASVGMADMLPGSILLSNGDAARPMPGGQVVAAPSGPLPGGTWTSAGAKVESKVTVWDDATQRLAFWYRVVNTSSSVSGFTYLGIPMPATATSVYLNQQLDTATGRDEAATVSFLDSVVGLNYTNPIQRNQSSTWAVIYTDFTAYTGGPGGETAFPITVLVSDGSITRSYLAQVGPAGTPIPEPGTYAAVFAVGLAAFAAYRRQCS